MKNIDIIPKEEYERIGKIILDCAFDVHRELGPGLLESVYEECLVFELIKKGLKVENQVFLPIYYKDNKLNKNFRIDVLVEDIIALELKSTYDIYPIDEAQLVTYMKLGHIKLGYVLNFNVILMKDGIKKKYNNYFLEQRNTK
ncbi:MAG: GxxExxY protein [Paludibacter sp.]|jgi:GxxExxY protein|nr:GxxExxY protein [Paludibacter sp.]